MEVQVYSNTEIELPAKRQHCQATEVQDSLAVADLPPIKEHIQAMELQESNAPIDLPATDGCSQVDLHENLHEIIAGGLLDFDSWTSLISDTEKMHADNIETISVVFDSFLSTFPLCAEYWKRYTDHKMRLCETETVVEIFERAVDSATHSVGLWVDYCSFSMCAFTDPFNIRRLFERALSYVGKDYLSHTLWDMYLKFEFSQQQWSSLAHIIIRTLKFPTKRLQNYYDNLKKFAAIMEEEIACQESCRLEVESEAIAESSSLASEEEIYHVINDLQDSTIPTQKSKALNKFICIGKQFYQRARLLDEKIHCFESYIERHVFHVQPLDENQLKNWHDYLDFIEKQEDFDWAVKLYERCLIACANYPEFWMRYVEFMELKGGQELAKFSLDRATQIFLKNVPEMHLFNAWCMEQIGDVDGARAAFLQCHTESNIHFVEKTIKEANMEKRLGNLTGACDIYEKALKVAAERHTLNTVSILYINLYRLKYQITGSADAARDVIINGIQHVPHCRSLLEELIKFAMMHDGSRQLNVVDSIIATEISSDPHVSQGLSAKDREELSCLYLEFVDLCGSNNQLRKAWNRHMKLFPHLVRTPCSLKNPITSSNHLLSVLMEGRQRKPSSVANQSAIGHDADNWVQHSTKEQEVKVLEHQDIVSDQVTSDDSDQSQQDGDNIVQESMQHISPQVVQSGENEVVLHKQTSALLQQSGSGMSGSMELAHGLHQCGEDSAPVDSNIDMVHPSHEDASGASDLSPDFEQPGGAITHLDSSLITDQEQDHRIEIPIKVVSLENLSLNSQEDGSLDINFAALERVDPQGISLPDDPFSGSTLHSEANVSAKREGDARKIESGSPSSSEKHQNPLPVHKNPQPEVPSPSEETWPPTNRVLISSGEAIAESHGQPQPQPQHQHQHQHQQVSPREQFSTAQIGGKIEVLSSSTDNRNYYQGASHGLTSPNVLQQSSGSVSQPVYSHTQAQISQYPMQSNEQLGNLQQTQAYNQILEYHYQHQLLQQQYQQQMLQMQQPYIQQQHQQPYYQPLVQQQYLQQHQKQQQQQQQPQLHLSPNHSNQLQQPQYQLYQHQEQYQQYQQGYQVLLQQYQLQQEQGYQQLLQQHQLQQLQGYQQLQQYQQSQQQQQQLHDGHQNHQQHITLMQNQGWKVIHDPQGQRIAMPPGSTVSPQPSEGPHTQEQSPQVPSQANASGATRPVGSSESQLSSPLEN